MADSIVEPLSSAAGVTTPAPVEPTETTPEPKASPGEGNLPDDLLKLPAFQALFAGQPPALSATLKEFEKRPETKLVVQNKDGLMKAGIGFYRSLSGDLGVVFNQFYLHPEELQAADKAGKLLEVAPPFDAISESVSKSGENNPVLKHAGQLPAGFKQAAVPTPPQSGGQPPSAAAQRKVSAARVTNLNPGAPTSGPSPGAGRLLNSILKPVL